MAKLDGTFLGGFAKGQGISRRLENDDAQQLLQEEQFEAENKRTLMSEAQGQIGNTMKVISKTISDAKQAGASPEAITKLVSGLTKDVIEMSQGSGIDPSRFVNGIETAIKTPFQGPQAQAIAKGQGEGQALVAKFQAIIQAMGDQGQNPQVQDAVARKLGLIGKDGQLNPEVKAEVQPTGDPVQTIGDRVTNTNDFEAQNQGIALNDQGQQVGPVQEQADQEAEIARIEEETVVLPKYKNIRITKNNDSIGFVEEVFGLGDADVAEAPDAGTRKARRELRDDILTQGQLVTEMNITEKIAKNIDTGALPALMMDTGTAQMIKSVFGVDILDKVGGIPLFEALTTQQAALALRLRNPDSGFGLTGNTSEKDLQFLKTAVPGIEKTQAGNFMAIMLMKAKLRRQGELKNLQHRLESMNLGEHFNDRSRKAWDESHDLFTPEEKATYTKLIERANAAVAAGDFRSKGGKTKPHIIGIGG